MDMRAIFKTSTRRLFGSFGLEITKSRHGFLGSLLSRGRIDHVIDVGANRGQFLRDVRAAGYAGPATAFEPLTELHPEILRVGNVRVFGQAIGDVAGTCDLNVYSSSDFSSIFKLNDRYRQAYANAPALSETRRIEVVPLDAVECPGRKILLKIDTQGSDAKVLRGATRLLDNVDLIYMELPFLQIYKDGCSAGEVFDLAQRAGFYPGRIFPNSITHWGAWVDADVVFFRAPTSGVSRDAAE
jgi:FkbM family methyltransferase